MSNSVPKALAAIVLCGGKSTRMGFDKSQLVFGNGKQQTTFLTRIVSAIADQVQEIVVVCDASHTQQHSELPENVIVTHDRVLGRGPLEGIAAGLAAMSANIEAAFVTSCDVPGIRGAIIPQLAAELGDYEAIVPVDRSRIYGLTAIYRRTVLAKLDELIARDQLRVSEIIQHIHAKEVSIDLLQSVDPALNSLANINTLDDYKTLAKRVGFPVPPELDSGPN